MIVHKEKINRVWKIVRKDEQKENKDDLEEIKESKKTIKDKKEEVNL